MLFTQYYSSSLSIFLKLHSHKHFVVRGFALTIPNVATTVKNRHTKIRRRVENLRHYRFLLLDIFSRNKPYKERKKEIKTENDSDQSIRKTGEKLRVTKWQVVPFVMSNGQRPNRNDTWPVTGWFLKYWKTKVNLSILNQHPMYTTRCVRNETICLQTCTGLHAYSMFDNQTTTNTNYA